MLPMSRTKPALAASAWNANASNAAAASVQHATALTSREQQERSRKAPFLPMSLRILTQAASSAGTTAFVLSSV